MVPIVKSDLQALQRIANICNNYNNRNAKKTAPLVYRNHQRNMGELMIDVAAKQYTMLSKQDTAKTHFVVRFGVISSLIKLSPTCRITKADREVLQKLTKSIIKKAFK